MERLTTRIGDTVGMAWQHEEKYTMDEWVDMLQTRLCEYEDTGLTPEEINSTTPPATTKDILNMAQAIATAREIKLRNGYIISDCVIERMIRALDEATVSYRKSIKED
jgi:hypothetical protein